MMFYVGDEWCPDDITSPSEILADLEEREPQPTTCSPPWHRLDCHGWDCDDEETRELLEEPEPLGSHPILRPPSPGVQRLGRRSSSSRDRGMDPGLFC